jgi:Spy/CpxP family protein refolding chaperone
MKRLLILLTTALLVIGGSLNAQPSEGIRAKQNHGFGINNDKNEFSDWPTSHFERMQKNLNLTDEQIAKMSDIRFEHQNMAIDLKGKIKKNRLIVRKMMEDNKIEKEKLLKIVSQNNELLSKIKLSKTNMWLDIYNILDDTQKEKWTKTFEKFDSKRREFIKQHGNRRNDCCKAPKHGRR